jgi:cytidylate kinase
MAVITISRQYGSGGDDIAGRVCELLGYRYFDKRMIVRAAAEAGLSEEEIVDFSEDQYKIHTFLDHLMSGWRGPYAITHSITWQEEVFGLGSKTLSALDEVKSITLIESAIRAAYQRNNVVIVGRGGQAILKDKPGVLHVRLQAPLDARVQRLHYRENYSLGGAQDVAIKRDRAAADYLKRFHHIDWNDSLLYHLVISTGRLDTEAAAQLIVKAVGYLPPAESVE